jgi:hypothetical protein
MVSLGDIHPPINQNGEAESYAGANLDRPHPVLATIV